MMLTEHEFDSQRVNEWCCLVETKVIGPFVFEETTVTGDTCLAVMENTALCHVPVGTVFQSDDAQLHFFSRVPAFLDRKFPDQEVTHSLPPCPRSPDLTPVNFFSEGL